MEEMGHAYSGDWKEYTEHGVGFLEREDSAVFNPNPKPNPNPNLNPNWRIRRSSTAFSSKVCPGAVFGQILSF